ncbi:ATP-dependent nuclease [Vibrio syngnathi]|uniref:Chromosome segregation protein n=1 Tax=Vibrio syngnathi TaxID=3034029 RepID=A0AA34XQ50_9VIBR|nr:ATP-dependent endonuclease [Vibrio syngnathi]ARP40362.1 chromosome segregation protein [Vibrio syngnathi]
MKIESIRVKNFRSFKDETILLDDYSCFVGSNGAGKSTVMNALNVFFRQFRDSKTDLSKLSKEDFHHKNTQLPIEITVTFNSLSAEAKSDLADYVRQGKLIVTAKAEYDPATERADVKQYGNRMVISGFSAWFDANKQKAKVPELKAIYQNLKNTFSGLADVKTKGDMEVALHDYEAKNPQLCTLVPSEDQFYGASKGANKIAPYLEWVFVSASKDFSEEAEQTKGSALDQLLNRVLGTKVTFKDKVSQLKEEYRVSYKKMLEEEQPALQEISDSLGIKLRKWSNPDASAQIVWNEDPEKSVKIEEPKALVVISEKGFEGELSRFGHGMQRSYLLSVLQELSDANTAKSPTLVIAVEEPELYQHPPQARYLAQLLQELDDSQVMVCTHSPYFIPVERFEYLRVVREEGVPCESKVKSVTYKKLSDTLHGSGQVLLRETGMLAKLYPNLKPEINEMFFCKKLILVEGIEDVAYIRTYIELMGKTDEFRLGGFHIIPVGGKSELLKPIALAKHLGIDVYVVCDADTNKTVEGEVVKHKKDNASILHLLGHDKALHWSEETHRFSNLTMWTHNITVTIGPEFGPKWKGFEDKAAAHYGNAKGLKKNPLAVSKALIEAWDSGCRSQELQNLVYRILQLGTEVEVKMDSAIEEPTTV